MRRPIGNNRHQSPITNHQSPITNHQSPFTNHLSPLTKNEHLAKLRSSRTGGLPSPGPAFIVVLTTALRRGFKPGAYATAGIVVGYAVYFFMTAVGLGSTLANSFWTFTIIKWLGITYLAV